MEVMGEMKKKKSSGKNVPTFLRLRQDAEPQRWLTCCRD